jgi:hypothetical protein
MTTPRVLWVTRREFVTIATATPLACTPVGGRLSPS